MGDSNSKDGKNSNLKGIGGILLTSVAVPIADKVIEKIALRTKLSLLNRSKIKK